MRLPTISIVTLTVLLGAASVQGGALQAARSPENLSDGRVTFRLVAPKATQVTLNGDWPGGRGLAMAKDAAGVWTLTTDPLAPEIWTYTLAVDGVTMLDPGNTRVWRDGVRRLNTLAIPGETSAPFLVANVPHGTVASVWYPSPTLGRPRRMLVYTPPGYERGTQPYPVLYLFHGGGGDEEAWNELGTTSTLLDNLIAAGQARPMIVVMPNANWRDTSVLEAGGARPVPPASAGAPAPPVQDYTVAERDIVEGIVPFVESHYRAAKGRENRAIAGLSMGGGISIAVGLKRLDVFASVGQFSTGMFGGVGNAYGPFDIDRLSPGFLKDGAATNAKLNLLYFSCGDEDPRMPFQQKVVGEFRAAKVALTFERFAGGHEWRVWRHSLASMVGMLFRPGSARVAGAADSPRVRLALVGAWHVHTTGFLNRIAQMNPGQVEWVAVWDQDLARGRQFAEKLGVPFEPDYQKVLDNPRVEAVMIEAETSLHLDLILRAARARKHVFTDKILTPRVSDALRIKAAVEQSGVKFVISHESMPVGSYQYARRLVRDGSLGEIVSVHFRRAHGMAKTNNLPATWWDPAVAGGGALIDLGVHGMGLLTYLAGEPVRVSARMGHRTGRALEDTATILVDFQNGAIGTAHTNMVTNIQENLLEVVGTDGMLVVVGTEGKETVYLNSRHLPDRAKGMTVVPSSEYAGDGTYPINRFIDLVRDRASAATGLPGSGLDIDTAIRIVAISEAAYLSAQNDGRPQATAALPGATR